MDLKLSRQYNNYLCDLIFKEEYHLMITIEEQGFSIKDVEAILFGSESIELSPSTLQKVEECHTFLKDFAKDKIIYGINTGFGPMAQYKVDDSQQKALQYNLIRSHATGTGTPLTELQVKSLMVARLNTLLKAKSGVHPSLILLIRDFINKGLYPVIYAHGGVGASGDLVQLAHFALALIGEGEIVYEGKCYDGKEAFDKAGLEPLKIHLREGLALMNGTSAMTGIGLINLIRSRKLINWSILITGLLTELVDSYDDHFSRELNQVKLHKGQLDIAKALSTCLEDSQLIRKREAHLYNRKQEKVIFEDKVQEYYSIRCLPQILGPILDTCQYTAEVLENELNSVNDNPIIDIEKENVYHGGNFHGDYVALEMDKLRIVMTKLTMLSERQLNFMLHSKLNGKFPPFANLGVLGTNYGVQGAQFTATSTTAENQMLSTSMYIHSIPNNNDNQDIVSMGTNAATMTAKVIENAFEVLAVQSLSILQLVDYLDCEAKLASKTKSFYQALRKVTPTIIQDRPLFKEIKKVKEFLMEEDVKVI